MSKIFKYLETNNIIMTLNELEDDNISQYFILCKTQEEKNELIYWHRDDMKESTYSFDNINIKDIEINKKYLYEKKYGDIECFDDYIIKINELDFVINKLQKKLEYLQNL